jgi:pimeloyl-ACP methyl ester carboxylesterase
MNASDGRLRSAREAPLARGGSLPTTTWCHRFARVDGIRLHWAELGKPSAKPPLVLLHGLNDCHRTWTQVASRLARDRQVLAPDLPGHGLSARPDASYELRWYARIMTHWLDTVGVDRTDVVGHSFGGGVALMMLTECPKRFRRLVLESSGGLGREIALCLRLASMPFVVEHLGQRFMGPCTRLVLKMMGDAHSREDVAWLSAMNAQRGSARAFARTVRDIIDWRGQRQTFFQRTNELTTLPPLAIFWGDHDTVIPYSHARALAKSVDGVRVTRFEACGHYPHHERPEAFLRALLKFLDASGARPARLHLVRRPLYDRVRAGAGAGGAGRRKALAPKYSGPQSTTWAGF